MSSSNSTGVPIDGGNDSPEIAAVGLATLKGIREYFCGPDCMGRPDLLEAGSSGTPRADVFLNAAQKRLDSLLDNPTSLCRYHVVIAAATYRVTLEQCRSVHSVAFIDSLSNRRVIDRLPYAQYLTRYPNAIPFGTGLNPPIPTGATATDPRYDSFSPAYWTLMTSIPSPKRNSNFGIPLSQQQAHGQEGIIYGSGTYGITSVLIAPAPVSGGTLEVTGIFESPYLTDDNDISFWTLKHPMTLAKAAAYEVEVAYRNMTGAREWQAAYEEDMRMIDRDMVDQQSAGITGIDTRYRYVSDNSTITPYDYYRCA